ncbi:Outer membrane protein assembly factor BamC [Saliniradius amylolyticus]|uniref:Outer membrane protein assembly factor BamC n=1 Tax=Saliniradius amylolyticus TaxID=2183582 RepID=A0A2S2E2Q4_9ALTE|nr:outer membrane protein assembly factor BamC [Saliniradius amylolyticus]AWL11869.1 Outer membrane protein assembly factor BamC [Saliniradius amylolyticus]
MIRHSALVLAVAAVVSGCSSVEERRTANGNFQYVEQQQGSGTLQTPPDLVAPKMDNQYALPSHVETQGKPVGKALRVDSPALVMPLVTGSRVVEGDSSARVYFEQVDDDTTLSQSIWNAVIHYLEENRIQVAEFDRDQGRLLTEWMMLDQTIEGDDVSLFDFSEEQEQALQRAKLEFQLDMKPHGRSGELSLSLNDYQVDGQGQDKLAAASQQRLEVEELNRVLHSFAQQRQIAQIKQFRQAQQGLSLEQGQNQQGEPAFVIKADYDIAWTRMQLVLRKLGFVVKDLDKSVGLLFTDYNGGDDGWWDSLFGGDEQRMPLQKQAYRFKLNQDQDSVMITLMNDASEPLDKQTLDAIYPAFADVMAQDDLDL